MPPALRGLGITFIITGLMAIGFMSFGGMLTGGDDAADKKEVQAEVQPIQKEELKKELADNTKKITE